MSPISDETQLYLSFHPSAKDAITFLVHCLDALLGWMGDNRLRLDLHKTDILRVGTPSIISFGASLSIGGATLVVNAV